MSKYAVASVAPIKFLDSSDNIIAQSTTLTDSGFTTSTSNQEIRGGDGNVLLAQYFHTSMFQVSLTDALSDLVYVALQTGSEVESGAELMTTETVVTTVTNQITVTGTPAEFWSSGTIGWYTVAGSTGLPTKITFSGKTASVSGLPIGTTVCVSYFATNDSARIVKVASNFIPAEVHAIIDLQLLNAGVNTSTAGTSSYIGRWEVDIPRLQLDGAISLATTSSSNATFALNGTALAYTTTGGCDSKSVYAHVKEEIYDTDEFANVVGLAIANGDITLAPAETTTLEVYKLFNDGTSAKLVNNSKLTFTSGTVGTATVGANTGLVTAVAGAGTTTITATITSKPTISDNCVITVTA